MIGECEHVHGSSGAAPRTVRMESGTLRGGVQCTRKGGWQWGLVKGACNTCTCLMETGAGVTYIMRKKCKMERAAYVDIELLRLQQHLIEQIAARNRLSIFGSTYV